MTAAGADFVDECPVGVVCRSSSFTLDDNGDGDGDGDDGFLKVFGH